MRVDGATTGVVVTRTGRPFFTDTGWEAAVLSRVRDAATTAGLWDELATDWLVLDGELLPWSAKAGDLLRHQYAAVGAAASATLAREVEVLAAASDRGVDLARSGVSGCWAKSHHTFSSPAKASIESLCSGSLEETLATGRSWVRNHHSSAPSLPDTAARSGWKSRRPEELRACHEGRKGEHIKKSAIQKARA